MSYELGTKKADPYARLRTLLAVGHKLMAWTSCIELAQRFAVDGGGGRATVDLDMHPQDFVDDQA